jgi:AraC-like DNA-binding protein
MELVLELRDGAGGPLLSGAHSRTVEIDTHEPTCVVGVHFKPGGAFPFLGIPVGELHNIHVSLDQLWGRAAVELVDRVLGANNDMERLGALEQTLIARVTGRFHRHAAVDYALRVLQPGPDAPTIADVTEQAGLSARRFIRVFTDQVGMTPKLYCRVRRFQKALALIDESADLDWSSVAYACGYYDQAHFIGDFGEFTGFSPTQYLRIRGDHLNHIPLAD